MRLELCSIASPGCATLVVGDVMLDEYIIGAPTRVSREAPCSFWSSDVASFGPAVAPIRRSMCWRSGPPATGRSSW